MAVYLIHFDRPISDGHTCQHYAGYAKDVSRRFASHLAGTSKARLCEVAAARGIGMSLAKVWKEGDRAFERKLKDGKNLKRHCPICLAAKADPDKLPF